MRTMTQMMVGDTMQLLATTLDEVEGGKLPVVLLDAIDRADIRVLLDNPLFGLSARTVVTWDLLPGDQVELRIEIHAYSTIALVTCFAWPEYRAWLDDVAAANVLKVIPVVRLEQVESSLLDEEVPGLIIRNFAGQLWPLLARLTKNRLF